MVNHSVDCVHRRKRATTWRRWRLRVSADNYNRWQICQGEIYEHGWRAMYMHNTKYVQNYYIFIRYCIPNTLLYNVIIIYIIIYLLSFRLLNNYVVVKPRVIIITRRATCPWMNIFKTYINILYHTQIDFFLSWVYIYM